MTFICLFRINSKDLSSSVNLFYYKRLIYACLWILLSIKIKMHLSHNGMSYSSISKYNKDSCDSTIFKYGFVLELVIII